MKCPICGHNVTDAGFRFCSNKCRDIYIKRCKLQDIVSGKTSGDRLDNKLKYCRETGITYAELQKMQTLGKI